MYAFELLAQSTPQSRGTALGIVLGGILVFGIGLGILLVKKMEK